MIPNEVRIGNWVLIPTNKEIKIPCFPKKIKAITLFGEFDFTEPTSPENHLVPAKHCMGIELTKELLIRLGFYEWSEGNFRIRPHLNIDGRSKDFNYYLPYFHFSIYVGSIQIRYVHEMQNLYYSHTGQELVLADA